MLAEVHWNLIYQVKLDVFVNPNKAIADYRTEITGISAKELDGVTYSLVDVQVFLVNFQPSLSLFLSFWLS